MHFPAVKKGGGREGGGGGGKGGFIVYGHAPLSHLPPLLLWGKGVEGEHVRVGYIGSPPPNSSGQGSTPWVDIKLLIRGKKENNILYIYKNYEVLCINKKL